MLKESWFVLGTGATARSAILALQQLGVSNICVVGRNHKILSVIKSDFQVSTSSFTDIRHMKNAINTIPISAQLEILDLKPREAIAFDAMNNPWPTPVSDTAAIELGSAITKDLQVLLDVVYTPWPTPFAIRVESQHGIVFDGLQMLIHQAHAQVEIMTGMALPVSIMSEAVTR
jgi:shikimate dehydrogenase